MKQILSILSFSTLTLLATLILSLTSCSDSSDNSPIAAGVSSSSSGKDQESSSSTTSGSSAEPSSSFEVSSSAETGTSSSSLPASSSSLSSSSVSSSSSREIVYGTLTDSRDGQTYKTVVIGTQTWMAENLNYAVDSSWCYNDFASYCDQYGRLYQWHAAMALANSCDIEDCGNQVGAEHQGICPDGWHVPDTTEWNTLEDYVDENNGDDGVGYSLKTVSGWSNGDNGSDIFGFGGLPGGDRTSNGGFHYAGDYGGFWWSSIESEASSVWYLHLFCDTGDFYRFNNSKSYAFSVRCLQTK